MADGNATKIYMPYEASGVLGGLSSIAELMREAGRQPGAQAATSNGSDEATHSRSDETDA